MSPPDYYCRAVSVPSTPVVVHHHRTVVADRCGIVVGRVACAVPWVVGARHEAQTPRRWGSTAGAVSAADPAAYNNIVTLTVFGDKIKKVNK